MKNSLIFFFVCFTFAFNLYSQEKTENQLNKGDSSINSINSENAENQDASLSVESEDSDLKKSDEFNEADFEYSEKVVVPEPKKPKSVDLQKIQEVQNKDPDKKDFEEKKLAINYGTPSEISSVIDEILENEDPRFSLELYDLFQNTGNNEIREKILEYFTKVKDPCLEDFAVTLLDDPYDSSNSLVEKTMNYVSEVECHEAAPALVKLLENGDEKYFNGALLALGKTGGPKEAVYLAEFIKNDELSVPQKQNLMRTLGKINASETFFQLVEIAQNEDENSFVRMYAAEAIGNMKKKEAVPILIKMYEDGDPNMRQYCIKGLANFPDSEDAKKTIIQAIRDSHYKVRIEAIKSAQKMNIKESVDFLTYRAKTDTEAAVKKECYPVIAQLNTDKGNKFLVEQLSDKRTSDAVKIQVIEALLKNGTLGEDKIAELAKDAASDDRKKNFRYSIGKLISKYSRPAFADVCLLYLQSKDAQTVSLGIDMYKNSRYEIARAALLKIAEDKKGNSSNRKRARDLLGLDEQETEAATEENKSTNQSVQNKANLDSSEAK